MRTLFLGLSALFVLSTPCFAQGDKEEQAIEQRYDVSKLLTIDHAPTISLEAFLLSEAMDLPAEFKPFLRLKNQRITSIFDQTSLRDVIDFYRDISGLNIVCSVDLDKTVNLRIRNAPFGDVLLLILEQLDADASFHGSVLFIHNKRQLPLRGMAPLHSAYSARSPRQLVLDTLERHVTMGEQKGDSLDMRGSTLIARQPPKTHEAIKKALASMIAAKENKTEKLALYQLRAFPELTLDQQREMGYRARLKAKNRFVAIFSESKFSDAFQYFKDLSGIPFQFDSSAKDIAQKKLTLRVKDVTVLELLNLLSAKAQLSYAITPEGLELFKLGRESSYHFNQRRRLRAYLKHCKRDLSQAPLEVKSRPKTILSLLESACYRAGFGIQCESIDIEKALKKPFKGPIKQSTLEQLLIEMLKPHKLHYRVVFRSVEITKNAEKTGTATVKTVFTKKTLLGMTSREFAWHLSKSSQSPIVFPKGSSSCAPITIPANSTIEQALKLASRQAGLKVLWLPYKKTGLWSITSPEAGLFEKTERALKSPLNSSIPSVHRAQSARRALLEMSLKQLGGKKDFSAALKTAEDALNALTDVLLFIDAHRQYSGYREVVLAKRKETFDKKLTEAKAMREALKNARFDTKKEEAEIAQLKQKMKAAEAKMRAAKKALVAPKLTRAQRNALEDEWLQAARSTDILRRRMMSLEDELLYKARRFDRDRKLRVMRFQQEWSLLGDAHGRAVANLALYKALKEAQASLKSRSWAEVFPKGWSAHREDVWQGGLRESAKQWNKSPK